MSGTDKPGSPLVMVVGCAESTAEPHVWRLTRSGATSETTNPGVTAEEKAEMSGRALGSATFRLVGVADFVEPEISTSIGRRGELIGSERVNATAQLLDSHKVVVKGLLVNTTPTVTINLTSVAVLANQCG